MADKAVADKPKRKRKKKELKDIPVTKYQMEWLYMIGRDNGKLEEDPYFKNGRDIRDIFREMPAPTRRKLVAHGLIEAKIEMTELGKKYYFIKQMKDI